MSLETYWTVAPIVIMAVFGGGWLWLRLTRPSRKAREHAAE